MPPSSSSHHARRGPPEPHTRVTRSRRAATPPPPVLQPEAPRQVELYTVGKGFKKKEREDLEERLASLHRDAEVVQLCQSIFAAAEQHLGLARSAAMGLGWEATREIPSGVDICVYTGVIRKGDAAVSNHCIFLSDVFGCPVAVDGGQSASPSARPGSMAMVNHACSAAEGAQGPNCRARYVETRDTLGLWILTTARVIRVGEQLTFDYDWTAKPGRQRRPFWSTGEPGEKISGHQLVRCRCAGGSCPLRRWRWERRQTVEARPARADILRQWLVRPASPARQAAGPSPPPPRGEVVGRGQPPRQASPPSRVELEPWGQDIDARPPSPAADPHRAQPAGAFGPPARISAGSSPPPPRGEGVGLVRLTWQEPIHRDAMELGDLDIDAQIGRAHV